MELNVLEKIESYLPACTKLQRAAGNYILTDPMDAAFSTVDQFAKKAKISTATVVRFANALGYSGYAEFQSDLQEFLRSRTDPIKRLEKSFSLKEPNDSILSQVYYNQIQNLENTFTDLTKNKLEQATNLILNAGHIYTFGARGSYTIAYYLAHHLNRVTQRADILPQSSRLPDYILRIKPNDVVIAINVPRYNTQIFKGTKTARERGAKIITITDSSFSPYSQISDLLFVVPYHSNDFHNTLMPALLISEMLITLLISKNYDEARESLNLMEPISDRLGTFLPNL